MTSDRPAIFMILDLYEAYAKAHPAPHITEVPQEHLGKFDKEGHAAAELSANLYEEVYNKSVGVFYCSADERYYLVFDNRW